MSIWCCFCTSSCLAGHWLQNWHLSANPVNTKIMVWQQNSFLYHSLLKCTVKVCNIQGVIITLVLYCPATWDGMCMWMLSWWKSQVLFCDEETTFITVTEYPVGVFYTMYILIWTMLLFCGVIFYCTLTTSWSKCKGKSQKLFLAMVCGSVWVFMNFCRH